MLAQKHLLLWALTPSSSSNPSLAKPQSVQSQPVISDNQPPALDDMKLLCRAWLRGWQGRMQLHTNGLPIKPTHNQLHILLSH